MNRLRQMIPHMVVGIAAWTIALAAPEPDLDLSRSTIDGGGGGWPAGIPSPGIGGMGVSFHGMRVLLGHR